MQSYPWQRPYILINQGNKYSPPANFVRPRITHHMFRQSFLNTSLCIPLYISLYTPSSTPLYAQKYPIKTLLHTVAMETVPAERRRSNPASFSCEDNFMFFSARSVSPEPARRATLSGSSGSRGRSYPRWQPERPIAELPGVGTGAQGSLPIGNEPSYRFSVRAEVHCAGSAAVENVLCEVYSQCSCALTYQKTCSYPQRLWAPGYFL